MTCKFAGQIVQVTHDVGAGQNVRVMDVKNIQILVCQVLRDISCVNPSRTPKAFKGKGSSVNQGVNSGFLDLAGACA